jgi:hypothetical protein
VRLPSGCAACTLGNATVHTSALFETVHADDNVVLQLSSSEEKTALGNHLKLLGRMPKLNSRCAVRVWRKKRPKKRS